MTHLYLIIDFTVKIVVNKFNVNNASLKTYPVQIIVSQSKG